jgi:hypothetical protein
MLYYSDLQGGDSLEFTVTYSSTAKRRNQQKFSSGLRNGGPSFIRG